MPAKTSKQSSDREKAARFVLSAFFQQGREISRLLADLVLPFRQDGDPEPDLHGTIVVLGRKLKDAIDRVVAADSRLFAANAALDQEREIRSDKTYRLSRLIIGLRGACRSLFVGLPVEQLGFDSRTAQDPVPLLIQADRVVQNLESGEIKAEPLFEGDDFDPKKYAGQLRARADELRACLDRVADLKRSADEAMLEKRELTKKYDDFFIQGARTFETFCRMVGKTELADRVRPSVSRPGRTEIPPVDESESAADSSDAGESESAVEVSVPTEDIAGTDPEPSETA